MYVYRFVAESNWDYIYLFFAVFNIVLGFFLIKLSRFYKSSAEGFKTWRSFEK